jgi:hypothetical protein
MSRMGGTVEIGGHFANPPDRKAVTMLVDPLADRDGFCTGAEEYADTSNPASGHVVTASLHESAMHFECQAEFDDISRARQGSAGKLFDTAQPFAHRVGVNE